MEFDPKITDIVVHTYGVMPRGIEPGSGYRLTVDSALTAIAAAEAHSIISQRVPDCRIHFIGATFFNEVSDAQLMKTHITHPRRIGKIPLEKVIVYSDTLNTVTQIAQTKKLQNSEGLGKILLICASWHKEDVQGLLENFGIDGQLITDKEILGNTRYRRIFQYLEEKNPVYRIKRDGLQARIFKLLNKIDKQGRVRIFISQTLGPGVAD